MARSRRWPRALAALLVVVAAGAFIAAVISKRRLEGAIPGESPILSLGVTKSGYLVGTSKGAFVSSDGVAWKKDDELGNDRTLVASNEGSIVVLAGQTLIRTEDLKGYSPGFTGVIRGVALSVDTEGNAYLAEDARHLQLVTSEGGLQRIRSARGPAEIIALAGIPGDPVTLLAGGLTSGMWRSLDGGLTWRQILRTPTRALLVDADDPKRVFLGTAAGVLVSTNGGLRWRPTEMRIGVEALSQLGKNIYAATEDRLIYRSSGGVTGWRPLTEDDG